MTTSYILDAHSVGRRARHLGYTALGSGSDERNSGAHAVGRWARQLPFGAVLVFWVPAFVISKHVAHRPLPCTVELALLIAFC